MNPQTIVTWLAIASAVATGAARITSAEERQANQLEKIVQLEGELRDVRGYLTAAEGRISALERDREMLERVHALEVRLSAMEARRR